MNFTETRIVNTVMGFKKRSDMHWARKIWHMLGVGLFAISYAALPLLWSKFFILFVWLLFVPLDLLRLRSRGLNEFITHLFKPIIREYEIQGLAGTTYLISGVALVIFICPKEVTQLTLLFLALADPLASYFGIRFGKDKIFGHKSIQGSFAAFVVCALLTYFYLYYNNFHVDRLIILSLLGGLIGTLAELIPIGKLDDNFTLPVVSALTLWMVFSMFQMFNNL